MDLEKRKEVLFFLGKCFKDVIGGKNDLNFPGFKNIFNHNPWFTEEFVKYNFLYWSKVLTNEKINAWLSKYSNLDNKLSDKTLAMILAGNIPLVGLHDIICGIISGVKIKIKLSSKDCLLTKWIIEIITKKYPVLNERIFIEDKILKDFDAVIATGSNNSNRYFKYYFGKYPNILRKNKNSVAVLSGKESDAELSLLADDIFIYFGLGCRSVSKIFVPEGYNFDNLLNAFQKYSHLIQHNKYANNYDYLKAMAQMNKKDFFDAGNILLIESENIVSAIAVLNFSYYNKIEEVKNELKQKHNKIQCVISNNFVCENQIDFGQSQNPKIDNYADNIDTINFLTDLKI